MSVPQGVAGFLGFVIKKSARLAHASD
jgi:hypothetical protein